MSNGRWVEELKEGNVSKTWKQCVPDDQPKARNPNRESHYTRSKGKGKTSEQLQNLRNG
jgi:hypothetical protein